MCAIIEVEMQSKPGTPLFSAVEVPSWIIMERREKILRLIDRNGLGLELGPSHAPIAPKREGFNVHIVDHLDRRGLLRKYADQGLDLSRVEEVDFVWDGRPFSELIGRTSCYDWIIASHFVEHVPDLICFIKECEVLLKDTGVLFLAIPDKRFCFDKYRPVSSLAHVLDCHGLEARRHTAGTVAEYYLNVISKGGRIAWEKGSDGDEVFVHTLAEMFENLKVATEGTIYQDLHAWVFVPSSFRLIMHDLYLLGFTSLRECEFFPTEGCEFMTTMSKSGAGPCRSRMELLRSIEHELCLA